MIDHDRALVREAANGFRTFLNLLLTLALCEQPMFAKSDNEWSPPSLRHFLIGLSPVESDIGGGACVLTADGRDAMLDQLAHADRASNSPDLLLVRDRWVRDQEAREDLVGREGDTISGRGCGVNSADCAQPGGAGGRGKRDSCVRSCGEGKVGGGDRPF